MIAALIDAVKAAADRTIKAAEADSIAQGNGWSGISKELAEALSAARPAS